MVTNKWWILFGVSLACFVAFVDFTIVSTALVAIQTNLSASLLQLQWVMNIFVLMISMFMVTVGRLGDVFGQRLLLLIGIVLFAFASLGAGFAGNPEWLILFRSLQGIATAILIPSSIAVIALTFPKEEAGRAMGIWTGITGIGMAIGPVLGGVLVNFFSWRYIFFINLPIFIISFIICVMYLEKKAASRGKNPPIDWAGFFTMSIAIACLVIPIIQSPVWGWSSPMTLGLFMICVVSTLLFIWIERRAVDPIIHFNILAQKDFLAGAFANFCLVSFVWIAFFLLPLYLEDIHDFTSLEVGLILLAISGTLSLTSPFAGFLADKFGEKLPIIIGLCLLFLSIIGQSFFQPETKLVYIIFCLIIMGFAWAMIVGPSVKIAVSSVPGQFSGLAAGALWTTQNIGGALGLAIGSVIFKYQERLHFLPPIQQLKPTGEDEKLFITLLSDPERLHVIMGQLSQPLAQLVNPLFEHSFAVSFSTVMHFFAVILLIATIVICFLLRKKSKSSNDKQEVVHVSIH